jgi:hypothetical protein
MRVPNLGYGVELGFHGRYPLLDAHSVKEVDEEKERFSFISGNNCDIDFPEKWKVFSTLGGTLAREAGKLAGIALGLGASTFGIPIAREGGCNGLKCYRSFHGEYG